MPFATSFIVFLFGCIGCQSCQPQIDVPDNPDNQPEPSTENVDTAETIDTGDTALEPPPCPIMEVEPNDNYDEAQLVFLEKWICGEYDKEFDLDNFGFQFPEDEGWLKVWGRAQSVGSLSDILITLDQGSNTAVSFAQAGTTDPMLIVPVTNEEALYATIYDQYGGYGENNFYEMMISQIKPPVEWNRNETDALGENNSPAGAETVEDGEIIFGTSSTNYDTDWFKFTVNEGETVQVTLELTAFSEGSPMDPIVYLYDDRIFTDSDAPYRAVRNNRSGEAGNLDPLLRYSISAAGDWAILVKNNGPGGSDFHWYIIDVSLEVE
mgnify:CR=1 FL=1